MSAQEFGVRWGLVDSYTELLLFCWDQAFQPESSMVELFLNHFFIRIFEVEVGQKFKHAQAGIWLEPS